MFGPSLIYAQETYGHHDALSPAETVRMAHLRRPADP